MSEHRRLRTMIADEVLRYWLATDDGHNTTPELWRLHGFLYAMFVAHALSADEFHRLENFASELDALSMLAWSA